jgi:hypothetical protein
MNDKDNQAFESWWEDIYDKSMQVKDWRSCDNLHDNKYNMAKAWRAACEYQQKEIEEDEDRLRYHMNSIGYRELKKLQAENAFLKENINGTKMKQMNDRIEDLLAKNKKLREALEFYAAHARDNCHYPVTYKIATEALKEVGEE